jgi:predicted ATPase
MRSFWPVFPVSARRPSIESIAPTPHLFKRARFGLIAETFHRVATAKPTILLIEDAHWLDPSTAELLAEITEARRDAPYMIIVTRRSFPKGPALPKPDETILLEQLADVDCLTLAMSIPGAESLPPEAIRAAAQAAEGVPLFVEQAGARAGRGPRPGGFPGHEERPPAPPARRNDVGAA